MISFIERRIQIIEDDGRKRDHRMKDIKHNSKLKEKARELRRNATPQEKHLWYDFLSKYPIRFRRQVTIDNYILDFYCAFVKLGIELDGSQHYDERAIEEDQDRTEQLRSYGIEVIRFSNNDVNRNFKGVCEYIDQAVKDKIIEKR